MRVRYDAQGRPYVQVVVRVTGWEDIATLGALRVLNSTGAARQAAGMVARALGRARKDAAVARLVAIHVKWHQDGEARKAEAETARAKGHLRLLRRPG